MTRATAAPGARQDGVVLAVVLILLLVMSLLAIASLRTTLNEERMSAAQRDRGLAFEVAEAALREAEEDFVRSVKPAVGAETYVHPALPPDATPYWDIPANWTGTASREASTAIPGSTAHPRYMVEYLGEVVDTTSCTTSGDVSLEASCSNTQSKYRITACSNLGGAGCGDGVQDARAEVVLQSVYLVP